MGNSNDNIDKTVELLNGASLIPLKTNKTAERSAEWLDTKFSASDNEDHGQTHHCSHRWIVAYMGVWIGIMMYLFHTNMSVAIVCMVRQSLPPESFNKSQIETTTYSSVNDSSNHSEPEKFRGKIYGMNATIMINETFDDKSTKNVTIVGSLYAYYTDRKSLEKLEGQLPSADNFLPKFPYPCDDGLRYGYYYGKILVQIPAGWLCTRFGGRRVIGCGMSVACVVTFLIPMLARTSVYLVATARFVLGIFASICSPTYCGLTGCWALPTERSRFMGLFMLGETFGTVIGYSTSGYLCAYGFDNGWGSIFYVHGIFGIIFVTCWFKLIYDSPEKHPRITESEKILIRSFIQKPQEKKAKYIPWRNILTYGPNYALFTVHVGHTWILFLLVTCLPQYMKEVLRFDIRSNGLVSSLPFVIHGIGVSISGPTADYIRKKGVVSMTRLRKIFVCIGFFGIAIFIVIPGYLQEDYREIAIASLCICMLFASIELTGGYASNAIDIAPRYSSVLFGLSNTIATLPGAIAPIIVAAITKHQTLEEWRTVFYLTAAISVSATIVYLIFGDSEQAEWSKTTTMMPQKQQDQKHQQ